jgi:hypothetical protein
LTASDVGVSPSAIKIGVWVPDIGAIANVPGVGNTGFDPATYKAAYDALAADLNARGGVLGRRIEIVYYTLDATNDDESNRQGCVYFTQQQKVFAIFVAALGDESSFDCIHRGSGAVTFSVLGFDARSYGANWLVTQGASINRVLKNYVDTFHQRGELRGKKIGLVDQAGQKRATDDILIPLLKTYGYKVTHRATMTDDTSQLGSQIPVEVNQMKAKGVDVVLLVANALVDGLVAQNANLQRFTPRWLTSDFNAGTDDLVASLFPANTDAVGLTATRAGEFRAGRAEPAYDASCAKRYNARTKGKPVHRARTTADNPYRYALYACTSFDVFESAAKAAGAVLTRDGWMGAVQRLGPLPLGFGADGTFGRNKTDAADYVRTVTFRPSCAPDNANCWMPASDFARTKF